MWKGPFCLVPAFFALEIFCQITQEHNAQKKVLETLPFCPEQSCVSQSTSKALQSQLPDLVHVYDITWELLACSLALDPCTGAWEDLLARLFFYCRLSLSVTKEQVFNILIEVI